MANLKLEHIYKVYPNGTKAVNDFSLEIQDKEFIVLVGPSGCGKSTTLRMIAGLEEISAGELYIGDTLVNDIEPKDRDIAMVFQNYALYPHMTVYENMAFGLTLRHLPRDVIHEKVMWAAEVLGLKEYLDRKPRAMSGGQRQRVALGRAILRNPKVMLLDEPLSNLDAKLRSQMRSEISKLHLKLQTTFIYVTHDQVEAMTLGTRVVVMKGGRIQQVDSPKNLYDYPANKFVAGFIGTPQMNFLDITLNRRGGEVDLTMIDGGHSLVVPFSSLLKISKNYLDGQKEVTLGIRCENLSLDPTEATKGLGVDVYVSHFEELGNETLIYAELKEESLGEMDSKTKLIIKADSSRGLKAGDKVKVYFDLEKAHYFAKDNERSISPRIPTENTILCSVKNNEITIAGSTFRLPDVYDISSLNGDAIIPISAVELGKTGDVKAEIFKIETINKDILIYLKAGETVFFALGNGEEKVGDKVYASFNFAKSTLLDVSGDKYEALKEHDQILGTIINYRTAISENPESVKFDSVRNDRMNEVKQVYEQRLAELKKEAETAIKNAQETDLLALNAKNQEDLANLVNESNAAINQAKAEYQANLTSLKKEKEETLRSAKKEIETIYKNRIAEEKEDYLRILTTNKDKNVIRSRKIEHAIFLENTPKEKAHDLDRKINAISLEFDTQINALKNNFNRIKNGYLTRVKTLKKKCKYEAKLVDNLNKDYSKKIKELEKEMDRAVTIAGLIFFFEINSKHMVIPEKIANKIIQGLGNKIFTKEYRLLVPHDGYVLGVEDGLLGKVIGVSDFGKYSFLQVSTVIGGVEKILYLDKSKYNLEVGDTFNFEIDFNKVEIYETSLNIRLY